MPPRITRLKWPRLFPPHEPLPFLYPRWYSVESATAETSGTSTSGNASTPEGQAATTQNELGATQPVSSDIKADGTQHGDLNVRHVPPSVKRKVQVRQLAETKRKMLREKSFYANDWRTPLMLLRKHTPEGEEHHTKQLERLEMPPGMRGFYPGNLPNLFLDIYLHTGCHVQISRDDDHVLDKFSALEISGTLVNIKMAKEILNDAVQVESDEDLNDKGSMGSYTTTVTPVVIDKALPRSVWSMPHTTPKELSHVPEPIVWSCTAFAAHVEDLVGSIAPPLEPKTTGRSTKNKPHTDLVTERLMSLYTNPRTVGWASMHATVQTLQYLSKHRKIPEVRRILESIELHSKSSPFLRLVLASPAVFNVLLHSASEALDLHSYNFLLRMMTDRNVAPNAATWTSLLQLVQKISPRNAKHIITTMRQRHMLTSPSAKIATANVTLQKHATEWLGRGESIFDFIAHYDKLWTSKGWLDTRACNQLLTILIETGNLEDSMTLVQELENRNRKPNLVTAHILLGAASSYRDLPFAVRALEATIGETEQLKPSRDTFDKLVHLAFKVRAYNTLRVVWRYACLSGNVSPALVRKMQKSFLAPVSAPKDRIEPVDVGTGVGIEEEAISRNQRFRALAAKIAVGIDFTVASSKLSTLSQPVTSTEPKEAAEVQEHTTTTEIEQDPQSAVNSASPSSDTDSLSLDPPSPTNPTPRTSPPPSPKHPLPPILTSDLLTHRTHLPVTPFVSSFRTAMQKDMRWKQIGYDKKATLEVLVRKAMSVWVQRKDALMQREEGGLVERNEEGLFKRKEGSSKVRRVMVRESKEIREERAESGKA